MASVIVIDDEASMRDTLTQMLIRDGHSVATAENGISAMEAIQNHNFHLAIIDILMPGKDGIETMVELKKISPSTKIIAMSGGRRNISADFNLDSAHLLGADGVLKKPFNWNELRQALEAVWK
ncbi:MAG: response regulator [Candidatus Thiodiazotropha sp.]